MSGAFPFLNNESLAAIGCSDLKRKRTSETLPFVGFESAVISNNGQKAKCRAPVSKPPMRVVTRVQFDAALAQFVEKFTGPDAVSAERQRQIMSYAQHLDHAGMEANPLWLAARKYRLTGSLAGAVAGWNPYSSPGRVLKDKLWGGFKGNAATRYGSANEDNCQKAFISYLRSLIGVMRNSAGAILASVDVTNVGLVVSREFPWAGMSPDGLLALGWRDPNTSAVETERSLVEYKCPWKMSVRLRNHVSSEDMYPMVDEPLGGGQLPCPTYYYAQIQYGMHLLRGNFIDARNTHTYFVVWSPAGAGQCEVPWVVGSATPPRAGGSIVTAATPHGLIQVCRVPYNPTAGQYLIKCAADFWTKKYAPAAVLKEMGALEHGETHPTIML
jgi:hypothetical protein